MASFLNRILPPQRATMTAWSPIQEKSGGRERLLPNPNKVRARRRVPATFAVALLQAHPDPW